MVLASEHGHPGPTPQGPDVDGDDVTAATQTRQRARAIVEAVADPDLPVLTLGELGVLRDVTETDTGCVHVRITVVDIDAPSTETIHDDIVEALCCAGYRRVDVEFVLSAPGDDRSPQRSS